MSESWSLRWQAFQRDLALGYGPPPGMALPARMAAANMRASTAATNSWLGRARDRTIGTARLESCG